MLLISRYAEKKLRDFFYKFIQPNPVAWRVVTFTPPVVIEEENHGVQMRLAANMVKDYVESDEKTRFFYMEGGFIVVACHGEKAEVLTKIQQGFCQLFLQEQPAEDFITLYDLSVAEDAFKELCDKKLKEAEARAAEQEKQDAPAVRPVQVDLSYAEKVLAKRPSRSDFYVQLAEDDPFTLHLVEQVFPDYRVVKSMDGVEALETYLLNAPDILFLDINMPQMSGHEVLEKILQFDPKAFVVMLSGNSYAEDVKRAMAVGAKGFVGKPFSKEKLYTYAQECLRAKA